MPHANLERSRFERVIVELDTVDPDMFVRRSTPIGMILGVAGGAATYHIVKEGLFPSNDQYEDTQGEIADARDSVAILEDSAELFEENGQQTAAVEAEALVNDYTATVAELTEELPDDYNPHVEGVASVGGAFLAAAVIALGFRRMVHKKAEQIRWQ